MVVIDIILLIIGQMMIIIIILVLIGGVLAGAGGEHLMDAERWETVEIHGVALLNGRLIEGHELVLAQGWDPGVLMTLLALLALEPGGPAWMRIRGPITWGSLTRVRGARRCGGIRWIPLVVDILIVMILKSEDGLLVRICVRLRIEK